MPIMAVTRRVVGEYFANQQAAGMKIRPRAPQDASLGVSLNIQTNTDNNRNTNVNKKTLLATPDCIREECDRAEMGEAAGGETPSWSRFPAW